MKILVLDDLKMGHLNQSLALCRLLGTEYSVVSVKYKNRGYKFLSYLLDRIGVYSSALYECSVPDEAFDYVVSAGSTCAYPLKVISRQRNAKSISMMLPRGYRYDYDVIFAQTHDNPPKAANIIEIPANFSYPVPKGVFHADAPTIGIVIGGNNAVFRMSSETLKSQLEMIFRTYPDYRFAVTTSPRTPKEIENVIAGFPFAYTVIYSSNPINPIPDFLEQCERIFITQDSTSMISEAVSFGSAYVEVLPLESDGDNKFRRLVQSLEKQGYLHVFDGTCGNANHKIDFRTFLRQARLVSTL